jgi:hypothetical protein
MVSAILSDQYSGSTPTNPRKGTETNIKNETGRQKSENSLLPLLSSFEIFSSFPFRFSFFPQFPRKGTETNIKNEAGR